VSVECHEIPLPRYFNPPSISYNASSFGYEEAENGELIQQTNPEKGFAETPEDAAGPGQYNANTITKRLGINCINQKLRDHYLVLKHENPIGPRTYNEVKNNINHNVKGSSYFLSKVKRTDLRGAIKKEEKLPGPGQYNQGSTFAQRVNFNLVQQFGTCAPRFIQPKNNSFLGPGEYSDNKKPSVSDRSKVIAKQM
jgi:hypothetical protein